MWIDQQQHGYVHGHQLLATSTRLDSRDQETVDRLSDLSGPLGPGEKCPPYLTGYRLPSGQYFVFARTWYDESVQRSGCVLTQSLLIPREGWATAKRPHAFLSLLSPFEKP